MELSLGCRFSISAREMQLLIIFSSSTEWIALSRIVADYRSGSML
jgi:hypothetical protein